MRRSMLEGALLVGLVLSCVAGCSDGNDSGASSGSTGGSASGGDASGGATTGGASTGGAATGGSGTGGEEPINVPRIDNTSGTSVLDEPGTLEGDGLCQTGVFCNGSCVGEVGVEAGGCTALMLGLGQTSALVLDGSRLFYTARSQEILRMDLVTGENVSLVTGLTFASGLVVEESTLYFSCQAEWPAYGVKKVSVDGGDVTLLAENVSEEIPLIHPLAEQLLLGVGYFDVELEVIPKLGGEQTAFLGSDAPYPNNAFRAYDLGDDGWLYYVNGSNAVGKVSLAPPHVPQELNAQLRTYGRVVAEGDYVYAMDSDNLELLRLPKAGGDSEVVATFSVETYLAGKTARGLVLRTDDEQHTTLFSLPYAGGTPVEVASLEVDELQSFASSDTHLYIGVGQSQVGGLLQVALPQ